MPASVSSPQAPACSCLAARLLGSRHAVRDAGDWRRDSGRSVRRLHERASVSIFRPIPSPRWLAADGPAASGFRRRARADQSLVGAGRRRRSAPRSAFCRALGPALTVALLLPVTFNLDPTAALIMFAGIYYGAMYGGSTIVHSAEHAGRERDDGHGDRGPSDGAPRTRAAQRSRPRRSDRSSQARSRRSHCRLRRRSLVQIALALRARRLFRADGARVRHWCARFLGRRSLRGLASLFIGLVLGFVGIDGLSGEARLTFGIPYLLDGIDVVIVAVGLFAVGEALTVLARGEQTAKCCRSDAASR